MSTPTCYLIKNPSGKKYDITKISSSFDWGGNDDSVARTLDIALINAPYDPVVRKLVNPACGDYVIFRYEKKERFYGRVYSIEKTNEAGTVTVHCIDNSQYLLRNTANKVFKNTTSEAIAKKICAEVGVPIGSIASTGVMIKKMICKEDTYIDMIMKAYTKAHKANKKKYMPLMKDRKFCIIEKGKTTVKKELSEKLNITGSSYTMSTEEIVDKVVAYDSKGKKAGVYTKAADQKKYGTFQTVYNKEDGVSISSGAKAALHGPTQALSIEVIGDISCVTGYGVVVEDSATGIKGKYWIKADTHHFENGTHTMSLELRFKNIMGMVADDDTENKEKKAKKKAKSDAKKAAREKRASKKAAIRKTKKAKKQSVMPGLPGV